ncbi:MAG: NADH-quinone oxidoreductase subunit NuoE [Deltaproteobacteria bacterium]|nr:NADH-quinone oxidoreductase subunit NuoE [Deltaproteobacteria bacterium]
MGNKEGFSKQDLKVFHRIIDKYKGQKGALIPVLQDIQDYYGYLPLKLQEIIAEGLGVPASEVFGVVTFYNFFTMVPRGRHTIKVCLGTACYVRGGKKILERLQKDLDVEVGGTTEDLRFSLEVVRCLGACGLAPTMMIDKEVHQRLNPTKLKEVWEGYK